MHETTYRTESNNIFLFINLPYNNNFYTKLNIDPPKYHHKCQNVCIIVDIKCKWPLVFGILPTSGYSHSTTCC